MERRYVTGFDENGKAKYDGWIVFSEWKFHNGTNTITREDCYLDDMIDDDDKKKSHPNEDIPSLFQGLWSEDELDKMYGPKPDDIKHLKKYKPVRYDEVQYESQYEVNEDGVKIIG